MTPATPAKTRRKPRSSLSGVRDRARSAQAGAAIAERRLGHFIRRARVHAELRRCAPGARAWSAGVRLLGAAAMRKLNRAYRRKDYATDVLSFPAPEIFRRGQGLLGELVLCRPVLQRQAREYGHSAARELDVLLVHGLLHLLGFDHERGARAAAEMARWEARLLGRRRSPTGLIARVGSVKS